MANNYHQLSLKDTFSRYMNMFIDDVLFFSSWSSILIFPFLSLKPFITLFISELAAKGFILLLVSFLLLSCKRSSLSPTDSLLIILLNLCRELRDFCGFTKIPNAPLFTRFKLGFADYIELMFQQMVNHTFDTFGIELYVTESNPKTSMH